MIDFGMLHRILFAGRGDVSVRMFVRDRRHIWTMWPGNNYCMPGLRKNTWSQAIIHLLLICQSCSEMKITLNRRIFIILIELLFNYLLFIQWHKLNCEYDNIKINACLIPDAGAASCWVDGNYYIVLRQNIKHYV